MDDKWFDRLLDAVRRDGRDMKAISLSAGLGENYVQQMLKDRKKPKINTLVRLLKALGRADTLYIITGAGFSDVDRQLLEVAGALDDEGKRALIGAFVALAATQPPQDQ
jgi:transcriptional regulator with XRE-family HTH domain